jgi:prepilin-type N-terminal cleavage/methylation domain-containing protein/prepilin-type processing-associated H-X9-DG protein
MKKIAGHAARGRPAFTLIELLVVVIIIAILIAILLGAVLQAYQYALCIQCQNQLNQIAKCAMAYITANGGKIPPTVIRDTANGDRYWCHLLANYAGVDAPDMGTADKTQGTLKTRSGQATVLICPSSRDQYVTTSDTWTDPTDKKAQGWCRLGTGGHMYDTSYYWNGYVGSLDELTSRYPSLALDSAADPTTQATQVHDVSEIKARSRLVMVADGLFYQDDNRKPQRVAARHTIDISSGGRTNMAFYDCHVEAMDRYPYPDWAHEVVSGYEDPTNTDPTRPPMAPIMPRQPTFDLSTSDQNNGVSPQFYLPRR